MAKANAKHKSTPTTAIHPPYFEMIAEAITTLKERTGSSQQAIAKFIEEQHKKALPPNFRKLLSVQLKRFVKSERLFKVKNSFKISSTEKLKLEINESQKNKVSKASNETAAPKQKAAADKGMKTKRLSQVKTPEALKKNSKDAKKKSAASSAAKVKRLTQVKTPEAMKKKNKSNVTATKRKTTPTQPINPSRPVRKPRK